MPNREGNRTPTRAVRVADHRWELAKILGLDRTAIMADALEVANVARMADLDEAGRTAALDQLTARLAELKRQDTAAVDSAAHAG